VQEISSKSSPSYTWALSAVSSMPFFLAQVFLVLLNDLLSD